MGKPARSDRPGNAYAVFLHMAYALLAILFTVVYFKSTHPSARAPLHDLAYFTGNRPFQNRVLAPALVHLMHWTFHLPLVNSFGACTAVFTFLLLLAFRKYLSLFLSQEVSDAGAALILYPVVWNYCALNCWYFPADIPAIAFFVFGLVLMLRGRMSWYYLSFVAAAFNRETICFLTLAYALTMYDKTKPARFCAHLAAQVAIWLGVRALILLAFSNNPGDAMEWHVRTNNYVFVQLLHLNPQFIAVFLAFGFIWVLIPLTWNAQPQLLKRLLWVIPPFVAGMYLVGILRELRIYAEIIPILTAPALVGIVRLARSARAV